MLDFIASVFDPNAFHEVDAEPKFRAACGKFDVFAQLDFPTCNACLFPQWTYMHTLIQLLPNACFILNTRPAANWLRSVQLWDKMKGTAPQWHLLKNLLRTCPISPRNETGLLLWYERHMEAARDALRTAKCAVEIEVEEASAGEKLARAFNGTSKSCWTQRNAHRASLKRRDPGPATLKLSTLSRSPTP
uniref:Uncharacterized protein n=1 Tax=Haptolina brevifila TaxID=156173 RepID=A0A7S2BN44_9EUKA|mmetsp:Transcript_14707/g.29510  ORF Transcript_14707/g.29510 Transcript_14707/m.29510 type:complete len:190 (+) Transcript_14707:598-1167(+)